MKVLFVNTVPTEKNGITNVIFNLFNSMDKDKLEIGYVAINKPEKYYLDQLSANSAKLFIIRRSISRPLKYISELAKVAKGYDIIHVHGNSATMVLEMIAAKIAKVPVRIAHSHNTTCSHKAVDRVMRPLFYSLCNGRLACGIEAGEWLFGDRSFTVVNNGINTEKFRFNVKKRDSIRQALGWEGYKIIGNIGNLLIQKNPLFTLNVFNELQKIYPDSRLILLGEGDLRKELEVEIEKRNLSNKVKLAGSVDNPQDYMNAMDIILMPSLFEGLPLTMIEEQANGLQILAADTITKDADITGSVSYQSLDEAPEKWADELVKILAQNENRENKSSLAIEKIIGADYDINKISEKLSQFYINSLRDICQ